jgi:hypothetical protein
MPYHVTRDGQNYGPYTLEDLQRYVSTGNVLLTDMARADDSDECFPVAQVLGGPVTPPPPSAATLAPGYVSPATPSPYGVPFGAWPDPPNLNWILLLVLEIFTCGLFGIVWEIVQLVWVRKVQPATKAMPYFIGYVVLSFMGGAVSAGVSAAAMSRGHYHRSPISAVVSIAAFVLLILYRFAMKNSLELHFNGADPIGLRLGPIMTFFFGALYFQYHFNRINEIKQAARYRGY